MKFKHLAAASFLAISFAAAAGLYFYLVHGSGEATKPAKAESRQMQAGYSLPTFIPMVRFGG